MKYVFSKLSSDQCYAEYKDNEDKNQNHQITKKVIVKGGAGVANKKTLVTPLGVVTSLDDNEFKAVSANPMFKRHQERGFIVVRDKMPNDADHGKIAADMDEDKSAPLTDKKLKDAGKKAAASKK